MEWLKRYKKWILESALVVGLVCVAAVAGNRDKAEPVNQETGGAQALPGETPAETSEGSSADVPVLSEKQWQLLNELDLALLDGNLDLAAKLLIEKESQFISLFYTTMEGKDYLYRDGEIFTEIEGQGLVFQKPGTLFYGNFSDGRPEGELLALQAIHLDSPRYDYSAGIWADGYMEGSGSIGYRYFEGTDEEIPQEVKKEGSFSKDLMNGSIVYTSISKEGQTLAWNMDVSEGVTVIGDNWIYNESSDSFQLINEMDQTAAFTVSSQEAETIRWINLIPWAR